MRYRICKAFEVESGHMLSKHPGRCRYPHGHSRRVEVVLSSETLDGNDMVCDFKAVKLAVAGFVDRFDHATAVNAADPALPALREAMPEARVVEFEGTDPTTEAMARMIFEHLDGLIRRGGRFADPRSGAEFALPSTVRLERVRVTETATSWAEYGIG